MTAYLPGINKKRIERKPVEKRMKSISFELDTTSGTWQNKRALNDYRNTDVTRSHGNHTTDRKSMSFGENIGDRRSGKTLLEKEQVSISDVSSQIDLQVEEDGQETCCLKESSSSAQAMKRSETSDEMTELKKLLRQKDREISRFQDVIRKMTLDRERAVCSDANTRLRVAELKNKLSSQHRHVEHVTSVERLRSKQKISSETERLRQERDEARAQLAQQENQVWQLRKQVDHLDYLSQQRYKTIQELGKKMAVKDKTLQELRKRMEQAQLIQVSTGGSLERRLSVNEGNRNAAWENASRLATVNK